MGADTDWSAVSDAAHREWVDGEREERNLLRIEKLQEEIARLRAELQNAAKAALDATALACEKEREADALRRGIGKALDELEDAGPKALKYAAQELRAAMGEGK